MEAIALTTKGRDGTYSGEFRPVIHDKQITLIQEVSLEEYLIGVVASEIGDYSPDEALKAQAVAARTKTLRTLLFPKTENTPEDFCNTTNVQVYRGSDKVKPNIREAVQATSGEILIYDGQVIDAVFSSNSGGVTESNQYIWDGMPIPYLQSVVDEPEAVKLDLTSNEDAGKWIDRKIMPSLTDDIASWQRKYYYWDRNVHIEDLEKISGIDHIRSVVVEKRGKSGRIMKLKLVGNTEKRYTNELQIRKLFGNLPSSLCYFTRTKSGFKVIGRGYGHGVGMCQSGAIMRALNGEDYRKILNKYYTNVELTRIHIGKN
jgi:SpoIID/LytB domain protein